VPVDFLNDARAERDGLQRAIDAAYGNVQEFEQDPAIALRCVAERLEPLVTASAPKK
jgi:hypothetical protein